MGADGELGSAVTLLRVAEHVSSEQRQIGVGRPWHPIRVLHGETRGSSGVNDRRIVVNKHLDGRLAAKAAQFVQLDDGTRTPIANWSHHETPGRQLLLVEPGLRRRAKTFGSAGQVDDLVGRCGAFREFGTDFEHLVVLGCGEERLPVLRPRRKIVQSVPDVGENAIDVEDDERDCHTRGCHDPQSSVCHISESWSPMGATGSSVGWRVCRIRLASTGS